MEIYIFYVDVFFVRMKNFVKKIVELSTKKDYYINIVENSTIFI